ncbi:MAG: hypothetical protein HC899_26940 [Leptolyngbyaceae cyanobacterium SM1_4_3]|nr:hypothetical protein [Leptolyngbyaceae cyanobacterium SM1_4_3]
MRRVYFVALILLGISTILILLVGSAKQEARDVLVNPPDPADLRGWEIYPAGQTPSDKLSPSP